MAAPAWSASSAWDLTRRRPSWSLPGATLTAFTPRLPSPRCAGVSPVPASSGKTNRHRLNRGGDRQANAALYRVVLVRLSHDLRTRDYMNRRTGEGMSKTEVIRCLKRYAAREVFSALRHSSKMPGIAP